MSEKFFLIGLCGDLKSGKDSVCKALWNAGVSAHRMAFADPLKEELAAACGVSVDYINANKDAFRLGLQWWGTEFRRNLCAKDWWIQRALARLEKLPKFGETTIVVFTDVRFPDEVDMIRENGGVIWRVVRPKGFWQQFKDLFAWKHASERLKVEPDWVIKNDGTLDDLEDKALEALDETTIEV